MRPHADHDDDDCDDHDYGNDGGADYDDDGDASTMLITLQNTMQTNSQMVALKNVITVREK